MAAPNTDTSALSNLVQTAYDQRVRLALRSMPTFRSLADSRVVNQTQPGSSVVFAFHPDMDNVVPRTPLNEIDDPTGVVLANPSQVTVTLNEYGNWTRITNKLSLFNLDDSFEANVTNILAYNQNDTVDAIVEAKLAAGTQVITEEGGTMVNSETGSPAVANVTATDVIASKHIRLAVAKLRGDSVQPIDGRFYGSFVHPDVAHDLRAESGSLGWRIPHEYGMSQDAIFAGEIGEYEGVRFIETPRTSVTADGGATTTDLYHSYIMGKEALAEAVAEEFHVVMDGVVVDALNRHKPIGWYGVAGWSLFRTEPLWVLKTASSIGDNA